jgi:hypothetical protein
MYAQMTALHMTVSYMHVWNHVLFAPPIILQVEVFNLS